MKSNHRDDSFRDESTYPSSYHQAPWYPHTGEIVELLTGNRSTPIQYQGTRATTIKVAGFGRVRIRCCDGKEIIVPVAVISRIDPGPRPSDLLHNGVWVVPPDKRPAGWEKMGGREQ
jgi:hypothetical protein